MSRGRLCGRVVVDAILELRMLPCHPRVALLCYFDLKPRGILHTMPQQHRLRLVPLLCNFNIKPRRILNTMPQQHRLRRVLASVVASNVSAAAFLWGPDPKKLFILRWHCCRKCALSQKASQTQYYRNTSLTLYPQSSTLKKVPDTKFDPFAYSLPLSLR